MVRHKRRNVYDYVADFCYYRTEPPPMLDTEDSFDSQLVSFCLNQFYVLYG